MADLLHDLPAPQAKAYAGRGERSAKVTGLEPWMADPSLWDFVRDEQKAHAQKPARPSKARKVAELPSDLGEGDAATSDEALQA
eukprot:9071186-Alexandrium_andersonii.AAC.1